jgi:hypothetical protein
MCGGRLPRGTCSSPELPVCQSPVIANHKLCGFASDCSGDLPCGLLGEAAVVDFRSGCGRGRRAGCIPGSCQVPACGGRWSGTGGCCHLVRIPANVPPAVLAWHDVISHASAIPTSSPLPATTIACIDHRDRSPRSHATSARSAPIRRHDGIVNRWFFHQMPRPATESRRAPGLTLCADAAAWRESAALAVSTPGSPEESLSDVIGPPNTTGRVWGPTVNWVTA